MELSFVLVTFGGLLLIGLGLDAAGRMLRLPRIALLVSFGVAIGPFGFDLLPIHVGHWYEVVAKVALAMVAFLLGGELSRKALARHGRAILAVSLAVTLVSAFLIGGGLLALGVAPPLALLLAGIGLATDPAATRDVVRESGAGGPLTKTVLGVVAIDDVWGVILFSVLFGFVASAAGAGLWDGFLSGLKEVFGAIAIGLALGAPAAALSGRIRAGDPTRAEALGIVLLCTGLSLWLEVSFLLSCMTAGAVIVNFARHHKRAFHEIEHINAPFLVIFFVLAGAALDVEASLGAGALGVAFIGLRLLGRLLGGWLGARLGGLRQPHAGEIGVSLTPQAGVALGMALVAANALPEWRDKLLAIAIGATVVFEIGGPLLTQVFLRRAGEARRSERT